MPTLPEHLALLDAMDLPSAAAAQSLASLAENDLRELVENQGMTWNPEALYRSQRLAHFQDQRKPLGPWAIRWRALEDNMVHHYAATKWGTMGACMTLLLWAGWPQILEQGGPAIGPVLLLMAGQPILARWMFGKDVQEFRAMIDKQRSLVEAIPGPAMPSM